MDDLINIFFENTFSEEQQTVLYKGLGVMGVFGFPNYGEELVHIIHQAGEEHNETIADQVFAHIEQGIDTLFTSHRIILEGEPSLGFKVSVMEGIYGIAYREDYQPYATLLSNDELTNEEKFAWIIGDIIGMTDSDILEHLTWVYEGTLDRLETFIEARTIEEANAQDIDLLKKIRRNILLFETAFGVPKAIETLNAMPLAKGANFDSYIQLLGEEIIDPADIEATTWRLIWIAIVSGDGTDNPQKILLERVDNFFTDLRMQNQFSSMLQKAMGHYQEHKEHLK